MPQPSLDEIFNRPSLDDIFSGAQTPASKRPPSANQWAGYGPDIAPAQAATVKPNQPTQHPLLQDLANTIQGAVSPLTDYLPRLSKETLDRITYEPGKFLHDPLDMEGATGDLVGGIAQGVAQPFGVDAEHIRQIPQDPLQDILNVITGRNAVQNWTQKPFSSAAGLLPFIEPLMPKGAPTTVPIDAALADHLASIQPRPEAFVPNERATTLRAMQDYTKGENAPTLQDAANLFQNLHDQGYTPADAVDGFIQAVSGKAARQPEKIDTPPISSPEPLTTPEPQAAPEVPTAEAKPTLDEIFNPKPAAPNSSLYNPRSQAFPLGQPIPEPPTPVEVQNPAPRQPSRVPLSDGYTDNKYNVAEWLRRAGGIDPQSAIDAGLGGEIARLSPRESGTTGLLRKGGMSIDDAWQAAQEDGYIGPDTHPKLSDLIDEVEKAAMGEKAPAPPPVDQTARFEGLGGRYVNAGDLKPGQTIDTPEGSFTVLEPGENGETILHPLTTDENGKTVLDPTSWIDSFKPDEKIPVLNIKDAGDASINRTAQERLLKSVNPDYSLIYKDENSINQAETNTLAKTITVYKNAGPDAFNHELRHLMEPSVRSVENEIPNFDKRAEAYFKATNPGRSLQFYATEMLPHEYRENVIRGYMEDDPRLPKDMKVKLDGTELAKFKSENPQSVFDRPLSSAGQLDKERAQAEFNTPITGAKENATPKASEPGGLFSPKDQDLFNTDEKGIVKLHSGLDLGTGEFFKQDIQPKAKAAIINLARASDDIRKTFASAGRGIYAKETGGIVRENAAALAQKKVKAYEALSEFKGIMDQAHKIPELVDRVNALGAHFGNNDAWAKMGAREKAQIAFADAIERHEARTLPPQLGKAAQVFRQMLDERWTEIQQRRGAANFIRDYMPHLWKDPTKAADAFAQIFGKRPLEGPKTFFKQRKYPTLRDGIEAGLDPVTTNPVDYVMLKTYEMDRYLMGQDLMNEMKARFSGEEQPGFVRVDRKIAGEKDFFLPEPSARILNNYLSPGLRGNAIYDAFRGSGNLLNQVQLGASGFHFTFATLDSITSKFALGVQELGRGQLARGLTHIAPTQLVTSPFSTFIKGSKVLKAYFEDNPNGAAMRQTIDALIKGGGRVKMDDFYRNSAMGNFWQAFKQGNPIGGALRAPFAAIEAMAHPIMEWYVPRMKLGVFADMAESQLGKWRDTGYNPTLSEQRAVFGKLWDSVDNRLGEMVYDNLFWNKAVKDIGLVATRSLGWNLGTLREIGGGVKDLATLNRGRVQGEGFISPRMAYTVALPAVTALVGGLMNYAYTGEAPQELKDYFFPRTGHTTPDGRAERVSIPSYMKDVMAYQKNPVEAFAHKTHPLVAMMLNMLNNEDYYGTEIRDKNDPAVKQMQDAAKYAGEQFIPFAIRNAMQRAKSGASTEDQATSFIGVMPAPKYVTQTKAQELIDEYGKRHFGSVRTRDALEKMQEKASVRTEVAGGEKDIRKLAEQSGLQPYEVSQIMKNERIPALIRRVMVLSPDEAMSVYRAATPAEQDQLKQAITRKVYKSRTIGPDTKREYLGTLQGR